MIYHYTWVIQLTACCRRILPYRAYSISMSRLTLQVKEIFAAAVSSVLPNKIIKSAISVKDEQLFVEGKPYTNINHNIRVVGFGKAVLGMARALDDIIGGHIIEGVISVPFGIQNLFQKTGQLDLLLQPTSKMKVFEGALNNLPDENSYVAANQIVGVIQRLFDSDLLIVLVSGGGSALLPAPKPTIALQDEINVPKLLATRGATIQELNIVRKQLSTLKGGGLANLAYPSKVLALIISDIIDDPIDLIASGPTVVNRDTPQDAWDIIKRYQLLDTVPSSVLNILKPKSEENAESGLTLEFPHVKNILIASNSIAINEAQQMAESLGHVSICLTNCLQGEAKVAGMFFASLSKCICDMFANGNADFDEKTLELMSIVKIKPSKVNEIKSCIAAGMNLKSICLIAGGETVVRVQGDGIGGRNQEMVLSCSVHLDRIFQDSQHRGKCSVLFLSAGTDGIDGPTDAAGAVTYIGQVADAKEQGLNAEEFLQNNDSHTYFSNLRGGNDLLVIGHTSTQVMDIQVLLIEVR